MLPALLLLLGLLAASSASPISASPECSQGSPEQCLDLQVVRQAQGPPASAEDRVPTLKPVEPKLNFISGIPSNLACDVCTAVVHEVQGWLGSDSTKEDVSSALEHACHSLPLLLRAKCTSLVDNHGSDLAPLVTKDTPDKVCRAVEVCSTQRAPRSLGSTPTSRPLALPDEENQGSFCKGCKKLLDVSASNLQSRSARNDILAAFKGGCSILPLPYQVQCDRFVTDYEPVLIDSLMRMMEPTTICKKVGACRGPQNQLLATDQCFAGPSFWCKSKETAALCHATEHCQHHVWKEAQA
ncbi:proactivator polypeptide-like 1 [Trichechus manatus latirostris]|uniref:Proactivator polypeptide-like 1 n=1 Tax=Trichechus manatus latirostris TaxID=127582 RepID=A0A2Y9DZR4_TRIMA|nr:proactivator polypeptide-like 1 [Trichechus manatus latirostris]